MSATSISRRVALSALCGAPVALVAAAPAIPAPDNPDPVFAAAQAYDAATERAMSATDWSDAVMEPLWEARDDALDALVRTRPTTQAGVIAMMNRVLKHEADWIDPSSPILWMLNTLVEAWPAKAEARS